MPVARGVEDILRRISMFSLLFALHANCILALGSNATLVEPARTSFWLFE